MRQLSDMKLVKLDGDKLTLTVTVHQSAANQEIKRPGAPPNLKTTLLSLKGTGKGKTVTELHRIVPTASLSVESDTVIEAVLKDEAQTTSINTKMTMDITRD